MCYVLSVDQPKLKSRNVTTGTVSGTKSMKDIHSCAVGGLVVVFFQDCDF